MINYTVQYSTIFNPVGMKEFTNRKDAIHFRTFCLSTGIKCGKIIEVKR